MSATASPAPASPKHADLDRQTYSLAEFAALLGIGYTQAHERAMNGTLPVAPIRVGRQYLLPRALVHRLLSLDTTFDQTIS